MSSSSCSSNYNSIINISNNNNNHRGHFNLVIMRIFTITITTSKRRLLCINYGRSKTAKI